MPAVCAQSGAPWHSAAAEPAEETVCQLPEQEGLQVVLSPPRPVGAWSLGPSGLTFLGQAAGTLRDCGDYGFSERRAQVAWAPCPDKTAV